jgi:glycosyltransferase involved in cell wall biosynthesis
MELMAARLAIELASVGHHVAVVCLEEEGPVAEELAHAGVRVELVPTPGLRTLIAPDLLTAWLRRYNADVVHSHSGVWLKAARAAQLARGPALVHTVHGLLNVEPWWAPHLSRLAARLTQRVVPVSEPLREYLLRTVRLSPSLVRVIPNGVDTTRFSPDGEKVTWPAPDGGEPGPVIGIVARFDPIKNHALLIEAFAVLRRSFPRATLALVGDGPLRADIERQVLESGLEGSVVLTGDRRDTPELYRSFDISVLSSNAEGTSMSILEAMASGCCIVATDVGGNGALLDRGSAGVLVPPGNAAALAGALAALLADRARRQSLGGVARDRAVATYSHGSMVREYEAVYREAISLKAAPRRSGGARATLLAGQR